MLQRFTQLLAILICYFTSCFRVVLFRTVVVCITVIDDLSRSKCK